MYEQRGDYQFIADYMEEAGEGALRQRFELLKVKLAAQGLFAPEHKRPLPRLPRRIGVVTSPTGAAIRDVLHILKRRFCGIPVLLYPVQVQGGVAAAQIARTIRRASAKSPGMRCPAHSGTALGRTYIRTSSSTAGWSLI